VMMLAHELHVHSWSYIPSDGNIYKHSTYCIATFLAKKFAVT
jgi:hypothetical protein